MLYLALVYRCICGLKRKLYVLGSFLNSTKGPNIETMKKICWTFCSIQWFRIKCQTSFKNTKRHFAPLRRGCGHFQAKLVVILVLNWELCILERCVCRPRASSSTTTNIAKIMQPSSDEGPDFLSISSKNLSHSNCNQNKH